MEVDNSSPQISQEQTSKPNPDGIHITFVDFNEKLVSAWQDEIVKQIPSENGTSSSSITVSTYLGQFQTFLKSTPVECMVSPANSFGLMDGGIDLHISRYYGGVVNLVPIVQASLAEEWCGEQNVGTCLIVDVHDLIERAKQGEHVKNVPRYIAHVPTMRVPKVLQPEDDLPYRCTWALLTAVQKHNTQVAKQERGRVDYNASMRHERINSILCAGFGTGAGQFPLQECGRQMVLAVKHFKERICKYSAEAHGLSGSNDTRGLMTLWEEAERIEDAVCSPTPEKTSQLPGSTNSFPKVFGK